MFVRRPIVVAVLLFCMSILVAGCGGGNEPVNAGKDLPVAPKKEKDKEK